MSNAALELAAPTPLLEILDEVLDSGRLARLSGASLAPLPDAIWRRALRGPLEDFLARPGKEFRARLVEIGWALADGGPTMPARLPWVVELLHAGSLIVDDIEDEAATRRGRPALHVLHGVPTALNAGNWLYFLPYQVVSELGLPADRELAMHHAMTRCLLECHQGQALDLDGRLADVAREVVPTLVATTTRLKTGALMRLAGLLGGIAAGAGPLELRAVADFGTELGVGLQMLDDLGGILSVARAHKGHEDVINGRPTWPWAFLAEDLPPEQFEALRAVARDVETRDLNPEVLLGRMRPLLEQSGPERVRAHLDQTLSRLESVFHGSPVIDRVRADISRLERSYE